MILHHLLFFLSIGGLTAFNVSIVPEEIVKFRTGETRSVRITIVETDSTQLYDGARSLSVSCKDLSLCEVSSAPSEVVLTKENEFTTSFNVSINAIFIGITDLVIKVDAETAEPYELRILRSAADHKVTLAFTIFISVFVVGISFMMGTQLEIQRILKIIKTPIGPITGFVCQFGLMPTIGYLLAQYGLPEDEVSLKLALFAVSCCPGGGKSSFWTIIFGGNLDLSISMTFTQTVAALFMMPLWMSTVGSQFTDEHVKIPFFKIIQGLVALMIPTMFGIGFTFYRPQHVEKIQKWIKRASWVAMIVITVFAVYTNWYMFYLITWPIILCGCALPWLGYLAAFLVATLFRQSFKDCLTIAIETGIQNIGIAMLLVMWCLPEPESDISVTIIFVVAIMTDKPLILIWLISRLHKRCFKKDKIAKMDLEIGVKSLGSIDDPVKVPEEENKEKKEKKKEKTEKTEEKY